MQWFRFYAKFATDPDVQMLSESYQRRWAMLLCFKCNGDETLQDSKIVFQLRVTPSEWAETKAEFMRLGFIDKANRILKWDKRQYRSDSSTERVYKHREQQKEKQLQQPSRNVSVRPPDTDTDTEESKAIVHTNSAELIYSGYPRKVGRGKAISAIKAALKKIEQRMSLSEGDACEFLRKSVHEYARSPAGNNGKFTPYCATWMNGECWTDDRREWQAKPNGHELTKAGKCTLHPDSGITPAGSCWGCAKGMEA